MDDFEENAVIVNALQPAADVVVQKSLAEGFGLTVAEAMWKRRAVVASRIGGIQDQIEHGVSGLLLDDPADLEALARRCSSCWLRPSEPPRWVTRRTSASATASWARIRCSTTWRCSNGSCDRLAPPDRRRAGSSRRRRVGVKRGW
jgi:glycosyltransferase involved in cell wall biosynthesis